MSLGECYVSCLPSRLLFLDCLVLKMEAVRSFEISVNIYPVTQCDITEG
jgi:hypothetical protein